MSEQDDWRVTSDQGLGLKPAPDGLPTALFATLAAAALPLTAPVGFLPIATGAAFVLMASHLTHARSRYGKPARLGSLDVASVAVIPSVTVVASAGLTVAGYLHDGDPVSSWIWFASSIAFAVISAISFASAIGKHRSGEVVLAFEPDVDKDPSLRTSAIESLQKAKGPRLWFLRSRARAARLAAERDVEEGISSARPPGLGALALTAWTAGTSERWQLTVFALGTAFWAFAFFNGAFEIATFPYSIFALIACVAIPAWALLTTRAQYEYWLRALSRLAVLLMQEREQEQEREEPNGKAPSSRAESTCVTQVTRLSILGLVIVDVERKARCRVDGDGRHLPGVRPRSRSSDNNLLSTSRSRRTRASGSSP